MNEAQQNHSEPIGGPEPIAPREAGGIFDAIIAASTISLGAFVAFVLFARPTRVAGATRSATILWQQRQSEIRQTIQATDSTQASANSKGSQDKIQQ